MEGHESLNSMPPAFVALNNQRCLRHIGQMYSFLEDVSWSTCVVCWRAWYEPNLRFSFDRSLSKSGELSAWFNPYQSSMLGFPRKQIDQWALWRADKSQPGDALSYLRSNYPPLVADSIAARLTDSVRKRDIIICEECLKAVDMESYKLQSPAGMRVCDYAVDPVIAKSALDDPAVKAPHVQYECVYFVFVVSIWR